MIWLSRISAKLTHTMTMDKLYMVSRFVSVAKLCSKCEVNVTGSSKV
jgi:hypothetical protein